jgi:8-oxo-dGTP diphosphatase
MRRFGEPIKKGKKYKVRVGIYGIICLGNNILLTEQGGDEIQLPGGGVDIGEHKIHALVRETYEETGWKIAPIRRLGAYQRFVYMPEYNLWAHKICHIYHCKAIYQISDPLEFGHIALIANPIQAMHLLPKGGDSVFVQNFFKI